ncbi:MAG: BrnT family toxin [Microcystis aeruginosa BS13-10]|uniref:BrnT family toxin n=1 Tax=Microcystis aeruginosa G11-04 TaxID=2685956 RepID=A0A966L6L1_MICAE|nr:BrnT family toxin [Microcystis aeruginosa BS13-10]NCS59075.1 BrnT family toxin [Microcystis aeruginosa G11-04]NCT45443.1 BrnT family toxin [Microcystis aeruginosa G11-09]
MIGRSYGGPILFIVYTRRDQKIRVVTARDATFSEKRLYRR